MEFCSYLDYHRALVSDSVRVGGWRQAIRDAVKPGDVVVDLGAGTGILSFLACNCGARRVYAIEESPILVVAQELAVEAGLEDRITFLQERSSTVRLPEAADVVLGDVFGSFGLNGNLAATMIDARERFLKPGGALLPLGVELFAVPAEMNYFYRQHIDGWSADLNGFDCRPCRSRAVNAMYLYPVPASAALAEPARLGDIDLRRATSASWKGGAEFQVVRPGVLHGVAGWCRGCLTAEIATSNSPFVQDRLTWAQAFFPVDRATAVKPGDRVSCELRLATHGQWMVWTWDVRIIATCGSGSRFRHSTFAGELLNSAMLRKQQPRFSPSLSPRGELVRAVLELCDGTREAAQIEKETVRRFPGRFTSASQASQLVGEVIHSLCQ